MCCCGRLPSFTQRGVFFRRVFLAYFAPPRGKHATKTRRLTGGWGRGDAICMWLGLACFHNSYSFLMISPNLHDIWPFFLLIPMKQRIFWHYLGFQVMAILCWAAKNSLRGTAVFIQLRFFLKSRFERSACCGFRSVFKRMKAKEQCRHLNTSCYTVAR